MQIPEPHVQRLLGAWPVARLATCAPDGRPRLVPIVFAQLGAELWSPIDGKPKQGLRELARVRHVRANPLVGVLLDAYREDWERLWWISLDGAARVVSAQSGAAVCERAAAALRAKYPQYAITPLFAGEPLWIAIHIERIRSWCSTLGALDLAIPGRGDAEDPDSGR